MDSNEALAVTNLHKRGNEWQEWKTSVAFSSDCSISFNMPCKPGSTKGIDKERREN